MTAPKKTILVVEDEKQILGAVKPKLESEGFSVVVAVTVEQALDCLKNGGIIDVVWLDHYLFGKKSGLDFVAKLKQKGSAWKNLPVFLISNTVSPEKIQDYLKLGVIKCYTKVDYRLDQIIADIKAFLETKNG